MLVASRGAVKLGQPQPESNFCAESNNWAPQQTQRNTPESLQSQYSPVNAGSVSLFLVTRYCRAVSWLRHSLSVLIIFRFIGFSGAASIIGYMNIISERLGCNKFHPGKLLAGVAA